MRARALLTIALMLALPASAQAADLYVDPHAAGCSDVVGPDVAGHAATPWCSPTPAFGLARPGDVVHLASATYGAQLRPLSSGTAAQPIVYKIAPGGGRIRGTRPPDPQPVVLSRNGKEFTPEGETDVRAGSEYRVKTERPSLDINVKELDAGSWVMFELPGFTTASAGTAQKSLDALRKAGETSYYKSKGSLWVKVVSTGDVMGTGPTQGKGPGDSLKVSR